MERYTWKRTVGEILRIINPNNEELVSLELTNSNMQLLTIEELGPLVVFYSNLNEEWQAIYQDQYNKLEPDFKEQFSISFARLKINGYTFICADQSNVLDLLK